MQYVFIFVNPLLLVGMMGYFRIWS